MTDENDDGVEVRRFELGDVELAVISVPRPDLAALSELTEAEREVAGYALEGLSNKGIAERRGTSDRTVANQLASIYRKLEINSRAELAAYVADSGE